MRDREERDYTPRNTRTRTRERERRDPARRRPPLSHDDTKDMLSEFGIKSFRSEYSKLMRSMGAEDFSGVEAAQALSRSILSNAIKKLADISGSTDPRSVYPLVQLGDHIRALAADIRTYGDQTVTVGKVREEAVKPTLAALATNIVADITRMRSEMVADLGPREASKVDKKLRTLQEGLAPIFGDAEVKINELVQKALQQ